jgi:hypothetical protein
VPRDEEWETQIIYTEPEKTGTKHDEGKPRLELVPREGIEEIAKVFAFGAEKYGENNYRGGINYSRLVGAALRHVYAFMSGEDKDPETGLSHMAHAGCCCLMLLQMEQERDDCDDRYAPEYEYKISPERGCKPEENSKRGLSFLDDPFGMRPTEKEPT